MPRHFMLSILAAGILAASGAAWAQSQWSGHLGIFDDAAMTQPFGQMTGPTKSIYVGMSSDGNLGGNSTGFEFSISGLDAFAGYTLHWALPPAVVLGDVAAPLDTLTGTGGLNVAWATCFTGGRAFLEIQLFQPAPPLNHVLRVHKRFPPSNPQYPYPRAATCDAPCYCVFVLRGDSYVLNPTVGVESTRWSVIKRLYR